jgi:hypothetical protein
MKQAALIAAAVLIAAALLGYLLKPPRYAFAATGSGLARLDTRTGEVLACRERCRVVVRAGPPTFDPNAPYSIEQQPAAR